MVRFDRQILDPACDRVGQDMKRSSASGRNVRGTWTERCECGPVVVRQTVGKVGLIIGRGLGHGFWTLFPESCRVGIFIGRAA